MCSKMKKVFAIVMVFCFVSSAAGLWADPVYPLDSAEVPAIDRWAMVPYSKTLSDVSTYGAVAMMGLPALLAVPCALDGNTEDLWQMSLEYALVMGGTYGTKELLKNGVARSRPYMYTANPPQNKIDEGEWNRSFPSGHTSVSFAAATYFSYSFCRLYPDSEWKVAACSAAYAGATAVAAMRVASGSHFVTDVTAAAALGTLWGLGVPLANRWINNRLGWNGTGNGFSATPAGFAVRMKW